MVSLVIAAAVPIAAAAYGVAEARMHRTRRYHLPVLPHGSKPLSILQVSDLHFRDPSARLASFLKGISSERFDLVVATGDLLGSPETMSECAKRLDELTGTLGRYFVFGSSDYYAPRFKNYLDYFLGRRRLGTKRNRTEEFRERLTATGWVDLNNRTVFTDLEGLHTQITGLDDPYLKRDDRSLLSRDPAADFALCVVHDPSPYLDAAEAGFDLIVGGHTHGGQVRLPFVGAVVTNSNLPRRLARGASKVGDAWLFVSPGLGTGKYAPFRFMCPPEASILNLGPSLSA
jgi:predicted MPP superfamily phosphohydrolase